MRRLLGLLLLTLLPIPSVAELPPMKEAPKRPPAGAHVIVQDFEVLSDCQVDKVCAEGLIRNIGLQPAHGVRLRIDIGGTQYGKPRTSVYRDLEDSDLEPTEAQSVSFSVDRKVPYKNEKGEDKILEVGRF